MEIPAVGQPEPGGGRLGARHLQPKYGIPHGVQYAHVLGVAELYEYEWFFGGFLRKVRDTQLARVLNIKEGEEVVYFPRRAFDMWNVRYFILPVWHNGWRDSFRGYASMMLECEEIYPGKKKFEGPGGSKAVQDWAEKYDFQVYRNRRETSRAWVVHSLRRLPSIESLKPGPERQKTMQEITYDNDPIWNDPTHQAFDFHRVGWAGPEDMTALLPYARGGSTLSSEAVKVTYPSPQRVELDVTLESPGVVVLADVYYPGWELTIDDVPAPIYRINRLMRGAAAGTGHHHLVFRYAPRSFRLGLMVSAVGLGSLVVLCLACYRRPVEASLVPVLEDIDHDDDPGARSRRVTQPDTSC